MGEGLLAVDGGRAIIFFSGTASDKTPCSHKQATISKPSKSLTKDRQVCEGLAEKRRGLCRAGGMRESGEE